MEAKQERIEQITKERKRLFLSATKLYAISFRIPDKAAAMLDESQKLSDEAHALIEEMKNV